MFFGAIFLAIGLAFLLDTLGLISGSFWGFFWSFLFIALGVKMMLGRMNMMDACCSRGKMHERFHKHWNKEGDNAENQNKQ